MGDLGYLDQDGYLHVVGRKQQLIIRGGQNISAAEFKEPISGHPDVSQVAVVGVPDPILGERVWVYVVPRNMRELDIATFKLPRGSRGAVPRRRHRLAATC